MEVLLRHSSLLKSLRRGDAVAGKMSSPDASGEGGMMAESGMPPPAASSSSSISVHLHRSPVRLRDSCLHMHSGSAVSDIYLSRADYDVNIRALFRVCIIFSKLC